jgi:hypothetical protein
MGISVLACGGSIQAHHSLSVFDVSTPIWIKGTVGGNSAA